MIYAIEDLRKEICPTIVEVYEVFKNYFGEEHVDLQDSLYRYMMAHDIPFESTTISLSKTDIEGLKVDYQSRYQDIIVWWPRVTVTNENNKSVDIHDLYAKICITTEGKIPYEYAGFKLNRATYSTEQFYAYGGRGYMHSHVRVVPKDDLSQFQSCCLGSGPIRRTIHTLHNDYDLAMWMLFCKELDVYVTVESLTGVPYNRLEEISLAGNSMQNYYDTNHSNYLLNNPPLPSETEFMKYYLEHGHFTFVYKDEAYSPGLPYFDYILDVSNAYIKFYNSSLIGSVSKESLLSSYVLIPARIIERNFYTYVDEYNIDPDAYIGQHVLNFKGKDISLTIFDDPSTYPTVYILNNIIAQRILFNILRVINFRFRNGRNNTEERDSSSCKNVLYL